MLIINPDYKDGLSVTCQMIINASTGGQYLGFCTS